MALYDKPYMFNIVLNSQNVSTLSSGNRNDLTYEFNWSNIPAGKYSMSFTYKGQNNSDFVSNDSPAVFLCLSSNPNVYQAGSSDGCVTSQYIGSLHAETHAAAEVVFYADSTDNPEIYFNSIPTTGPIRIKIFRANFTTPFTTVTGGLEIANYVMILHFKQIGKLNGYNI